MTRQDDAVTVRLYRLASKKGDAAAICNLGGMYKHGRGVAQDDKEAVRLYRLAADNGSVAAIFNLGNMYKHGRGVMRDDKEAVRLWRPSAIEVHGEADVIDIFPRLRS